MDAREGRPSYPKDFFEQRAHVTEDPRSCFAMMPFNPEQTDLYEGCIKPACESVRLKCRRADELSGSNSIMYDVLRGIRDSRVLLFLLNEKNCNVFYELGIAHTVRDPQSIVLVVDDSTPIPFDVKPYRCIVYHHSIAGCSTLHHQLQSVLREITQGQIFAFDRAWRVARPYWFGKRDSLVAEIGARDDYPLAFCEEAIEPGCCRVAFTFTSDGAEVNTIIGGDGTERFSGYHFWIWKKGVKVRRLDDQDLLAEVHTDAVVAGASRKVVIEWFTDRLRLSVDQQVLIDVRDPHPLAGGHHRYVGLNSWASDSGYCEWHEFALGRAEQPQPPPGV